MYSEEYYEKLANYELEDIIRATDSEDEKIICKRVMLKRKGCSTHQEGLYTDNMPLQNILVHGGIHAHKF